MKKVRVVQWFLPGKGRRVGLVLDGFVFDLTAKYPDLQTTYQLFFRSRSEEVSWLRFLRSVDVSALPRTPLELLLEGRKGQQEPHLLVPLDHPDPACCLVSGTGLTHLGSASQRARMHAESDPAKKTDSQKMFEMGLQGGKLAAGRGVQPEWFYKGDGQVLRGPNEFLEIPSFCDDGGEEPEIVGCYINDRNGAPCRLGFSIGNEWSDHVTEKQNYLWLAPSKLRSCSLGPELVVTETFRNIKGRTRIYRDDRTIFDSGEFRTGEENMCHSLANMEDHHFKYPQFRRPGDVHMHFFGAAKLSFGNCEPLAEGDRIRIEFEGMGAPLVNYVRRLPRDDAPVKVRSEHE